MKLDVGCGSFPSGDVNCDSSIKDHGYRWQDGRSFNPRRVKNFVFCDVQRLLFREGSFDLVYSSHVIEHVSDPIKMLKEMVRVSKSDIKVVCPHWIGDKLAGKNPYHISYFRLRWFYTFAKRNNLFCKCFITQYYRGKISLILNIPSEITALFTKIED